MSTPNMGMTLPTDHDTNDTWGALLNAALTTQVDAHDHTTGKGVLVPVAGLNINADLSFGGTRALKDALAFDMTPTAVANVASYSSALFTNSADNNLYFRNSAGINIQFTAGNTLNFSVTGGIGGDYTAVGALVDFIDAQDTYRFRQQVGSAVQQYARMQMGDIDLFEYKAQPAAGVPANRVRLKSPAALAASYDLTWITALPGVTEGLSVDTTGQITAGGKHGLRTLQIHGTAFQPIVGTPSYGAAVGTTGISVTGAAINVVAPIPLRDGDRLLAIRFYVADSVTGPTKVQGSYGKSTSVGGAATTASTAVSAGTGANQTLSILALTDTIVSLSSYWLTFATTTGTNLSACYMVEIDYDHP